MKRLDTPASSLSSSLSVQQSKIYEFRVRRDSSQSCPLELFTPLHYEPGYAYPLIVWLHGAFDNESQLRRIMPLTSTRNFVAVGPRATCKHAHPGGHSGCYRWSQDSVHIEAAARRVELAIESATTQFNVNPSRVFLAGYQDGATMALRLALQNPHDYAGVISVNGPFPEGHAPLRNLGLCEQPPILLMHCHESSFYPEDQLCNDIRLGYSAGLKMDVREYLCGDGIMTDMLEDMNGWVMQQIFG
ncbi:hypothetical protein GC197_05825 [bacterium]|nr:hypothetical protein [bacterium]